MASRPNGETYAPDEIATVAVVAAALGSALDALHTAAVKDELARVLAAGAPLEALRRTVDAAAWLRAARGVPGAASQPAGSFRGLIE